MSEDEAPKSAVELALARLRRKDEESGIEASPLGESQRAAIAEIRKRYLARLAEAEILYNSAREGASPDPAALEELERQYRRDRERLASEREAKIEAARRGEG